MITTGKSDITSKDTMDNIFDFSVGMGYLNKSSYNNHFTYKISINMDTCETCKVCGEKLIPFDCENYEVDPVVKYVDVQTFVALAAEIKILKDFVSGRILNETEEQSCPSSRETITNEHTAVIHKLEENVKRLAGELKDKEKIIEILFKNLSEHFKSSRNSNVLIREKSGGTKFDVNLKSNLNRIPSIYEDSSNDMHDDNWHTVRNKRTFQRTQQKQIEQQFNTNYNDFALPIQNRFTAISPNDNRQQVDITMQIIISIGHNNIITGIPAGKSSNVNVDGL